MLREEALVYLKAMLEGVDPVTGELFDEEHVCCDEHVREALKTAVQVLDETEESIGRWTKKNGQLHAARPWTDEECEHLTALYCDGKEMDEICTILQRRWRGVLNKMVELGLVRAADIEKKKRRKQKSSASKTQKSWTAIDDKTLWEMYEQYQPIDKMAEVLQRSRYAVYCRMERFGMTGFADGYPKETDAAEWTRDEVSLMRDLHARGFSAEEIAEELERPLPSVKGRLFAAGLSREAPFSLRNRS